MLAQYFPNCGSGPIWLLVETESNTLIANWENVLNPRESETELQPAHVHLLMRRQSYCNPLQRSG